MKRFNLYFVLGIALIAYAFGNSISLVGEIPDCGTEPYTMSTPLAVLVVLCSMFLLGYFAHGTQGSRDQEDEW